MVHHEADVILGIGVKGPALRDEAADELMVAFGRALLPGSQGITVEDPGAPAAGSIRLDG